MAEDYASSKLGRSFVLIADFLLIKPLLSVPLRMNPKLIYFGLFTPHVLLLFSSPQVYQPHKEAKTYSDEAKFEV